MTALNRRILRRAQRREDYAVLSAPRPFPEGTVARFRQCPECLISQPNDVSHFYPSMTDEFRCRKCVTSESG